jgi:hypothetical protein
MSKAFFGLLHMLEQRQSLILQLIKESRPAAAYLRSIPAEPGLLMPFQSLGMGILLQILLRVLMEHGSILGTYHHFICLVSW